MSTFYVLPHTTTSHSITRLRLFPQKQYCSQRWRAQFSIMPKNNTNWWIIHRQQLSRSREGALRYFAILALTHSPELNIAEVKCLVTDKRMLESNLCYELGTLIHVSFLHLDEPVQDALQTAILTLRDDKYIDENLWILGNVLNYYRQFQFTLDRRKLKRHWFPGSLNTVHVYPSHILALGAAGSRHHSHMNGFWNLRCCCAKNYVALYK